MNFRRVLTTGAVLLALGIAIGAIAFWLLGGEDETVSSPIVEKTTTSVISQTQNVYFTELHEASTSYSAQCGKASDFLNTYCVDQVYASIDAFMPLRDELKLLEPYVISDDPVQLLRRAGQSFDSSRREWMSGLCAFENNGTKECGVAADTMNNAARAMVNIHIAHPEAGGK